MRQGLGPSASEMSPCVVCPHRLGTCASNAWGHLGAFTQPSTQPEPSRMGTPRWSLPALLLLWDDWGCMTPEDRSGLSFSKRFGELLPAERRAKVRDSKRTLGTSRSF